MPSQNHCHSLLLLMMSTVWVDLLYHHTRCSFVTMRCLAFAHKRLPLKCHHPCHCRGSSCSHQATRRRNPHHLDTSSRMPEEACTCLRRVTASLSEQFPPPSTTANAVSLLPMLPSTSSSAPQESAISLSSLHLPCASRRPWRHPGYARGYGRTRLWNLGRQGTEKCDAL